MITAVDALLCITLIFSHAAAFSPYTGLGRRSPAVVGSKLSVDNNDESNGLGGARAMLFQDQHHAMADRAEVEKLLLDPNTREMAAASEREPPKSKRQRGVKGGGGRGFGGGSKAVVPHASATKNKEPLSEEIKNSARSLQEKGVVLVPGVLQAGTADALRETVLHEHELMREDVRRNPAVSKDYFYVPAEIHFSSPRGYVLLPLRDAESIGAGPHHVGSLVRAARELLEPGSRLAALFGEACDGAASELYDFCALRTEAGAARQTVHSDTPYQEVPGLFCAFIALQDITLPMGGTMFIPGTHMQTTERLQFDEIRERDEMLAAAHSQYALLRKGDAAFFDMRVLHAGLANQVVGGGTRLIMAVTFRNLRAVKDLGHRPNLRPAYAGKYTLGSFQADLMSDRPFVGAGNGLFATA